MSGVSKESLERELRTLKYENTALLRQMNYYRRKYDELRGWVTVSNPGDRRLEPEGTLEDGIGT